MTLFITNASAIAVCNTFVDQCENDTPPATWVIYAGAVPADADAALGGATEAATLTFANPAFGAAADAGPGAIATANAIVDDSSATGGTAAFFRWLTGTAGTVLCQGAVGTSGAELNLNTTTITATATVSITSCTVTMPES